jgi:hypothetical protein
VVEQVVMAQLVELVLQLLEGRPDLELVERVVQP